MGYGHNGVTPIVTVKWRNNVEHYKVFWDCNAVRFGGIVPMFRRNLLAPSSGGSRFLLNFGMYTKQHGATFQKTVENLHFVINLEHLLAMWLLHSLSNDTLQGL